MDYEKMADELAARLQDMSRQRFPLNEELRMFARRVASQAIAEQIEADLAIIENFRRQRVGEDMHKFAWDVSDAIRSQSTGKVE